jgi:hypothetical protein
MGIEDWLIDGFNLIRAGYVSSQTTTVVEQITGRRPNLLNNLSEIMLVLSSEHRFPQLKIVIR